jgi:hypothetical protein
MKSKFFVILAIIALVGFMVTLDYGWAEQEAPTAEEVEEAKAPIPVEFSNFLDREAQEGLPPYGPADWGLGNPNPEQMIYTEPPDAVGAPFPSNTFDFGGPTEVDAAANGLDAFFHDLIANNAVLLVSFEGDPGFTAAPPPFMAVYAEDIGGTHFPKWSQPDLVNDPVPANEMDDLDALEVWGPYGTDDADYYSQLGDAGAASSVFTMAAGPYVPVGDIVAAVVALGYTGPTELVDLDALMVWDGNFNQVWDDPDTIIFSIRASAPWDGGEIVVLPFLGKPASAFFLFHGGHLWDTAFDVATAFSLDPPTEEVDAIEAYPQQPRPQTPALTEWGMIILVALLIASTIFVMLRRRKAAVPA